MTTTQTVVFALLTVAVSFPLSAQWKRAVFSGKGEFEDVPEAHALSYFTTNPFLRDDGAEFCTACTPSGKAESTRKYTVRSIVKPVGVLAGFRIINVLYYVNARADASATDAKWKSILVQVDRYKEIFHLQAFYTTASIGPARIIQSGKESVLATMDLDGGNGGGCWEGYWWFANNGPNSLDFSPLEAAIRERLSALHEGDATFQISRSNLNLSSQYVKSGIQKSHPQCHACDGIGELTAHFRLDGALVQPATIEFQPGNTIP
jgi:hypothetical protein